MKKYTFWMLPSTMAIVASKITLDDNHPRFNMTQEVFGAMGTRISLQTLVLTEEAFHDTLTKLRNNPMFREVDDASETVQVPSEPDECR